MTLQTDIESLPVSCLSGSAGDITASHNQFGPYFRARTVPFDPQSVLQRRWRQTFATQVRQWALRTPAQRLGWEDFAVRLRRSQPGAKFHTMNGRHHYIRSNAIRSFNGLPVVHDPPVQTTSSQLVVDAVETFGIPASIRIFFDNTLPWANENGAALIVSASPRLSSTIHFHRSPMRTAGQVRGTPGPPPPSPARLNYPFGTAMLTVPIVVSMRISRADGRLTEPRWFRAEVAT